MPFYLCPKPSGMYFRTQSSVCEGLGVAGTLLGYVAAEALCDAQPLYRLYAPGSGDHFYTTSVAERDNAITAYGYQSEGIVAYIFMRP